MEYKSVLIFEKSVKKLNIFVKKLQFFYSLLLYIYRERGIVMLKILVKMTAEDLKQYESENETVGKKNFTFFAHNNNKAKLESLRFFIV